MPPSSRQFWNETLAIFKLGFPIIATQMAQAAMGFTDTVMAGRYGDNDLAAIAMGSSLWMPVMLSLTGVLLATTPLIAQAFGGNNFNRIKQVIQQSTWLALVLGILAGTLLWHAEPVFHLASVDAAVTVISVDYLQALAWGLPATALYQVLRSSNEAFHRTQPIMVISFIALACNIPLNYLLIYGAAGLPELGGAGCGWATSIVMWIQFLILLFYSLKSRSFKKIRFWADWSRPAYRQQTEILRLGIPIGISLFIEVSMFTIIALFLAPLGPQIVAGHQITISFSSLLFMIPLSLAMALTIRTGYALGKGQPEQARFICKTGLILAILIASATSLVIFLFANTISTLYTESYEIQTIATKLLVLAAIFQFSDALQVTSAGALRGYKDTKIPMFAVFFASWLVGLPLGYSLGLTEFLGTPQGPEGFWIGLIAGLTAAALLLVARLHSVTRKYISDE
ncbi:hypothetical protein BGP75_05990 [Motiliproteus sp. MSK22-1]|nr:hypothetical protein BGP75_05990 [Motiliproteus sp. MSK22-1]